MKTAPLGPVRLLGRPELARGTYLLRILVCRNDRFAFGKFQGGQPLEVPAGEYVYVGSALAQRGATTLPRRLLRHATRSGDRPPHPIRERLLNRFRKLGLGGEELLPQRPKRLHWNVDYLLDRSTAVLAGVIALCTPERMEERIAALLATDEALEPLAAGLGAHDSPTRNTTHLYRLRADASWWKTVPVRLEALLREAEGRRGDGS